MSFSPRTTRLPAPLTPRKDVINDLFHPSHSADGSTSDSDSDYSLDSFDLDSPSVLASDSQTFPFHHPTLPRSAAPMDIQKSINTSHQPSRRSVSLSYSPITTAAANPKATAAAVLLGLTPLSVSPTPSSCPSLTSSMSSSSTLPRRYSSSPPSSPSRSCMTVRSASLPRPRKSVSFSPLTNVFEYDDDGGDELQVVDADGVKAACGDSDAKQGVGAGKKTALGGRLGGRWAKIGKLISRR